MEVVRLGLGKNRAPWWRLVAIGVGLGCLLVLQPLGSSLTTVPPTRAQQNDDAYDQEVEKGRDLLKRHKYEESLKSFKRANDMRDKKSAECFIGMAQAYQGLAAYKNVQDSCDRVIELAGGDPPLAALACNLKGIALQALAAGKEQKKLLAAEAAFRQGLTLDTKLTILHYNLGMTLLQQGRDPEGISELQQYLKLQPHGTHVDLAQKAIENPRRAREDYAPDFSVTTSEGEYIALDDLRGKVVLLDFWGTWCPPCVASVPALRSLNKKYAKDPSFVMIGISTDSEEEKWRTFTAENKMVWPQYRDRDHKVVRAFDVHAFPTYILIDPEGIVRFRSIGTSWERSANLEEQIRKYLKAVAKSAPAE
jgi:peroxiredoxin